MFFKILTLINKIRIWHCKEKIKKTVKVYTLPISVNGYTVLSTKTSLGKNTNFNGLIVYGQGELYIGDNFHSGPDCLIITQNHNYDHGTKIPYDASYISKTTTIEDNVWLGSRVIILGGITVGEGAIIQAGSVVANDVPKYAVAGGHPAKIFKTRNIFHYQRLKAEEQFH
jgi:acetyltransferase-like isoleucine patch superfamily enzyme